MKKKELESLYLQVRDRNASSTNGNFVQDFDRMLRQYTVAGSLLDMWDSHKEYLVELEEREEKQYMALEHADKELQGDKYNGIVDQLKELEIKLEKIYGLSEDDMCLFYKIQKKIEDIADNINLYV